MINKKFKLLVRVSRDTYEAGTVLIDEDLNEIESPFNVCVFDSTEDNIDNVIQGDVVVTTFHILSFSEIVQGGMGAPSLAYMLEMEDMSEWLYPENAQEINAAWVAYSSAYEDIQGQLCLFTELYTVFEIESWWGKDYEGTAECDEELYYCGLLDFTQLVGVHYAENTSSRNHTAGDE